MAPKQAPPEQVEDEEEDLDMMEGEEGDEEDGEYDEMGFDLGAALEPFLATEDGQTICTALVTIAKHMENQNKILIKILSQMSKSEKAA
jgi:hypothetical protein